MSSSSPTQQLPSPGSSNDDLEQNLTPPPLQIPPEIQIFQQQNFPDHNSLNNNSSTELNYQADFQQTPTLNSKKSFCIDALLAKNQNENGVESSFENKMPANYFMNNNYKDNVISRDLNNSPDAMSR